ncbi:hypothetical protein E1180_06420 [Roseibium denhamense]|uniref:PASTA domain-containing protein n=1 Tax=Roseibium denhamense TaxID=76305 RepID=A0ABY1NZC6_9HYPH|nr:hypothetical protein [Roseibium denhamense]MTI05147.1 hypothetical protein [Roseibium denhamense]SMP22416.1 hypothetical protein SAMN06265374_2169 [Roseibium denhamense]
MRVFNTKKLRFAGTDRILPVALGSALIVAAMHPAAAQTRRPPLTTEMTCGQAQELVESVGAINLRTGQFRFDRYVAGRQNCSSASRIVRVTPVPTKDRRDCPLNVCVEQRLNNK